MVQKEKVIGKVISVQTDKIAPNPYQPRQVFDEDLKSLAESISQNGILQPLTVRKINNSYELIAGERRLRAAKLCGLEAVPCVIHEMSDRNSALMALVENLQRKDLHFFEEAVAIQKLIEFYGMTQEDAAIKLGKTQSAIANKLRILKLSEPVRNFIAENSLTERHARAILKLETEEMQLEVLATVAKRKLNVEATERYIAALLAKEAERRSIAKRSAVFKDVRIFVNTIDKAIEIMKAAGIAAISEKKKTSDFIEYTVRIPSR